VRGKKFGGRLQSREPLEGYSVMFMWRDDLLGSAGLREERTRSVQGWQPELDVYEHPEGVYSRLPSRAWSRTTSTYRWPEPCSQ
jgi:hypothetical protein